MGTTRGPIAAAGLWIALCAVPGAAGAQHLFKCGTVYQDRPCANEDVQQRFSGTSGKFSVQQVNPDTDKDCAETAQSVMPWWERLRGGEPFEKLKAEIEAKPIARAEKSRMRDGLVALREFRGTPRQVRSELERVCMDQKRTRGLPTERDTARAAQVQSDAVAAQQLRMEQARARAAENRAIAEQRAAEYEEARARAAAQARAAALERQRNAQR